MQASTDTAAHEAVTGESSPASAAWPAPSEWPAADAHPLDVARFWRDRMHAMVLPTPSAEDTRDYAAHLHREFVRDHRQANANAEPSPEVDRLLKLDAADLAADARKAPIPRFAKSLAGKTAATLSDAELSRIWGDKQRGAHRGVCIILGDLAQVDVDPRHGGDITGEWASIPGPRVSTPGGGVHVFTIGAGVKPSTGKHALAPGVEVRTSGYAVVPSGSSSPNRQWMSVEAPRPAPSALCRGGTPPARSKRRDPNATPQPWDDAPTGAEDGAPGRVAYILAVDAGEGERNAGAQAIVGMLARPVGLPDDAVRAALNLLGEWGAGQDWNGPRAKEEAARWHAALTRGPRDAEFAAEVVATWISVRDVNPRRWSAAKARTVARSVWKTCDRREEGNAGAEDMAGAGGVADYTPPTRPLAQATTAAEQGIATEASPAPSLAALPAYNYAPVVMPSAGDEDALAALRRQVFLRRILPSSAEAYPDDAMDKDMERIPLRIDSLYPFFDFWKVAAEDPAPEYNAAPVGHGYGRWFASAVGGLLPGDFKVIGGAGAKIGKTYFLGQGLEGLALDAAARILGIPGYEKCPIVMTVWVTEMPKPGEVKLRMLSRQFGFDMSAITMATAAEESAGIMHMANESQCTPDVIVKHARAIVKHYRSNEKDPVGFVIKHLNKELALSEFPAPTGTGRNYVDHASGVNLISHLADAVALRRTELAQLLGVNEDEITPIIAIDPGQRFIGGDGSKKELDAFLNAIKNKLCLTHNGLGAIVLATSDTTKAAVKEIDLDTFMSGPGPSLAADIFAGSQGWMHIPDTVIAVCGEKGGASFQRTQWVRVLQSRTGTAELMYPFRWETHIGRFRPRKSEPLRAIDPERGGRGGRGDGPRGGGRTWAPAAPGGIGDRQ